METLVLSRLGATFLLSLFFGLERQKSHKPVGFGTFIFVSLGASALGIIATSGTLSNSITLMSAVVTGIGFLGAGALIKGTDKVFGFTTAASIWLFSIFGLTIGAGFYQIGTAIYLFIWLAILIDKHLEKKGIGSYQRKLTVVTNRLIDENEITPHFLSYTSRHKLICAEIKKEEKEMHMAYIVEGGLDSLNNLVRQIHKEEWLKTSKIE